MPKLKEKLIKNLLVIHPDAKFRNGVGSTPVMGNTPFIVWPPAI